MSLCTHNVHYFCLHAVVQVGNVHPGCRKSWDSEVGCGTGPCQLGCTDSNEAYGMMPWGFGFSSTRVGVSDHQTPTEQQVSLEATFVLFFLADRASNGKRWEMAWASFCGSGKLPRFPSLISVKDWDWRLTCGQWDPDIFLLIIIMCSHPVLFPLPVPSGQPGPRGVPSAIRYLWAWTALPCAAQWVLLLSSDWWRYHSFHKAKSSVYWSWYLYGEHCSSSLGHVPRFILHNIRGERQRKNR